MAHDNEELRPPVDPAMSYENFERWYWPVESLNAFCERLGLPKGQNKARLRAAVAQALGKPSQAPTVPGKARSKSHFNWSKAELNERTRITDNVSFGPNVRNWFKRQIGPAFVCHSDFMDWVQSNTGATLKDAIDAWYVLERRKAEPGFQREIALCNNYLRYLRDARDDNPALSHDEAMKCWHAKKLRPASDGFVIYEKDDLRFLD